MKARSSNSRFFFFVAVAACAGTLFFLVGKYLSAKTGPRACAFCQQAVIDKQKFYEDDLIVGIVNHKPIAPGHVMIISKRHVEHFDQLTDQEIASIGEAVKKVHAAAQRAYAASSYLLLQKNGTQAGQTVPHMHVHYIPRKQKEEPGLGFLLRFFFVPLLPAVSDAKMQDAVKKMQSQLQVSLSDTAAFAQ